MRENQLSARKTTPTRLTFGIERTNVRNILFSQSFPSFHFSIDKTRIRDH